MGLYSVRCAVERCAVVWVSAGPDSALTPRQREATAPLLARRDQLITLLSRSDPAAAEQLTDLYVSYRKAVNEVQSE